MAYLRLLFVFLISTFISHQSLVSAIDASPYTSTFASSYYSSYSPPVVTSSPPSPTTATPPPPFSSDALKSPPQYLNPLASITQTLAELGFHDLALASHSLSLSSASHVSLITVFAPMDSSVRTCPSCSLSQLLQEHTVPGLYPLDYLNRLIFGTKIETILAGKCLTVTSSVNATKIFIGGAEITRPNLYVSDHVIIHGMQGFISHLSSYSCSIDRMTSLSLPHPSSISALNKMMMAEAMIRLRTSGYSILALAMRVKYAELITLHNMTIFAVDDSSIFHGGHSYVHSVRFHIVPNRILKLANLESLPAMTALPTLEIGETLTVTTPGGGGSLSPMRINYVKSKYPNLIYNLKMVVHGLTFPFPHLRQTVTASGRSGFYPAHSGEFRSDERYSTDANVHQTTAAPSPVMQYVVDMDDIHQGLAKMQLLVISHGVNWDSMLIIGAMVVLLSVQHLQPILGLFGASESESESGSDDGNGGGGDDGGGGDGGGGDGDGEVIFDRLCPVLSVVGDYQIVLGYIELGNCQNWVDLAQQLWNLYAMLIELNAEDFVQGFGWPTREIRYLYRIGGAETYINTDMVWGVARYYIDEIQLHIEVGRQCNIFEWGGEVVASFSAQDCEDWFQFAQQIRFVFNNHVGGASVEEPVSPLTCWPGRTVRFFGDLREELWWQMDWDFVRLLVFEIRVY